MAIFSTDKLGQILSNRKTSLVIIGIAIASRVIQLIYFYTTGFDLSYQVMATHNFVTGHGISISIVSPADLSATIYEPLIRWPPGYTLLLAPLYVLFDHNYIAAGLSLDIIAAVTLILVSRNLLKLLGASLPLINLFTLLTGFFIYHFYFIASSDAIAITAFIVALYYALSLLKDGRQVMKKTILMIIFLFLCGFIKYLFIPVVLIIPAFLILKSRTDHQKLLQRAGMLSFFVLVIALGGMLLYQKYMTGSATYISQTERGFFPEHLLTAFPFIPGSFIKPETISLAFHQDAGITGWIYHSLQCVHVLVFSFFMVFVLRKFFRQGFKNLSLQDHFFYLVFFISLAIFVLLAFLSIRVEKEEVMPGVLWTYIQEPRYYGLVNVLLHFSVVIIYVFYLRSAIKWLKYAFYILLLILLPEMFRGIIFTGNRLLKMGKESYSWQLDHRFQKQAAAVLQTARQEQPVDKVVVTGTSLYINHRIAVYSHVPILLEAYKLNDLTSLVTLEKVLVLFIVEEKALPYFQPAISARGMKMGGYSSGFFFYTFLLKPR